MQGMLCQSLIFQMLKTLFLHKHIVSMCQILFSSLLRKLAGWLNQFKRIMKNKNYSQLGWGEGNWGGKKKKYWESIAKLVAKLVNVLSSVQFSCLVMSDSLWPHGLQQARLPCPSPTPGASSNSCPSSPWCHPTISSPVIPFFSHLQSFLAQGLFKWVSSLHQVAKVLEFLLQHQSFQWIFRTHFL